MKASDHKLTFVLCSAMLLLATSAWGCSVRMAGNQITRWPDAHVDYYIQLAGSDDLSAEQSLVAVYTAFAS